MSVSLLGIADGQALGGSMRVIVTEPRALIAARAAAEEVVAAIDAAASRFREDSELSRLNSLPDRLTRVSPLLADLVQAALHAAALTNGAVDPTVGRAIRLAGYDSDFALVSQHGEPLRLVAEGVPGWKAIQFSRPTRTVLVPRGVELDLGATAKAAAADMAAANAAAATGTGVLVSLGGDVAVAGEAPPGGWLIQASEDSEAPLADEEETVSIASGGVATSGTTVRRWVRGEVVLHHIIDPATGLPVESCWRTATVAAGSCVDANTASTAAVVMGERAPAWLRERRMTARLVHADGSVVRLAGWPDPADSKPVPNNFSAISQKPRSA